MSQPPGSLDDFLSEISASLGGSTGEAALRRINTERVLRLALEEIVQQRHDLHIRLLADRRIAGQAGADLLMQIDDYEIRLALLDSPSGKPELTPDQIDRLRLVFEENPSTEAMVLTWSTEDLLSQKLNLQIVEFLRAQPEKLESYLQKARPLPDVIAEILAGYMKIWELNLEAPAGSEPASGDIRKLFEEHFKLSLIQERERSYKNPERKEAALRIDEWKELALLNETLDEALQNQLSTALSKRLVKLPRRGGK